MLLAGVLENNRSSLSALLAQKLAGQRSGGSLLIRNGHSLFFGQQQISSVLLSSPLTSFFEGPLWDLFLLAEPPSDDSLLRARLAVTDGGAAVPGLRSEQVISCGPSCRDTLTFSSLSETQGVLAVQRRIECLNGRFLEPGEFSVYFRRGALREAMLISGALLGAGVVSDSFLQFFESPPKFTSDISSALRQQ